MTAAWMGDGGGGRGAVRGSSTRSMTWITDMAAGLSALVMVAGSVLPSPLTVTMAVGALAVPAGGAWAQGRAEPGGGTRFKVTYHSGGVRGQEVIRDKLNT